MQSLLLVDGDARSLRVLEVSLRKAGFIVTAALSVQDALDKLELHAPDLIISETTFPEGDGFELRRRVRGTSEWSEIPFIFLTAEAAIENKIRGLELGVDDYLTKPIYIKEIVTRINILLQKKQRTRFEERRDVRTRFAGRVQDMPVVDVIQTIEISRKSGVIQFVGERGRQAAIYFRDGRVIDAEAGSLQGEDAVYRLLTWGEGEFEVAFRTVRRREVITMSSQALLMEGMRRLDEWSRLFEQLPPLAHRFEVDIVELAARLGDVPDNNNRILRLFDGKRTLLEVIDASDVGDLECLQAISRLYFEELLVDLDHGKSPRRETGKSVPLVEVETPNPFEEFAAGPSSAPSARVTLPEAVSDMVPEAGKGAAPEVEKGVALAEFDAAEADAARATASAQADEATGDDEANFDEVGPLMGGYRQSSLRLIDEAVAAAQAIEPSLFDELIDAAARAPAAEHAGNGVSRTVTPPGRRSEDRERVMSALAAATEAEKATAPEGSRQAAAAAKAAPPTELKLGTPEREESGLRMIGSLGRDRAEAFGELAALGRDRALHSETARELVTILPRRATRELPALTPEIAESLSTPTSTSSVPAPTSTSSVPAPTSTSSVPAPTSTSSVPAPTSTSSVPAPASTSSVPAPKPIAVPPVEAPEEQPSPERQPSSQEQPPPSRVPRPGSGVRAPTRSTRLLRLVRSSDGKGLGSGVIILILLVAALAGAAVVLRLRRQASSESQPPQAPHAAAVQDAASPSEIPNPPGGEPSGAGSSRPEKPSVVDRLGAVTEAARPSAPPVATGAEGGAAAAAEGGAAAAAGAEGGSGVERGPGAGGRSGSARSPGSDVGVAAPAAGSAGTNPAGASGGSDKVAEAKALFDKAHDALDEGNFQRAFELAEASLKLRKTARTYLLRAQAEQRLDRVAEALASVDAAAMIAPEFSSVWETRGRILWAVGRHDEARAAFEKFLALEPNGPKAAGIQRLLNEPR